MYFWHKVYRIFAKINRHTQNGTHSNFQNVRTLHLVGTRIQNSSSTYLSLYSPNLWNSKLTRQPKIIKSAAARRLFSPRSLTGRLTTRCSRTSERAAPPPRGRRRSLISRFATAKLVASPAKSARDQPRTVFYKCRFGFRDFGFHYWWSRCDGSGIRFKEVRLGIP